MAASRTEAAFTYSSSSGGQTYQYDIVMDSQSNMSVRNVRGPYGLIQDPNTTLPQSVLDDIASAMEVVEQQLSESDVTSGSVDFEDETEKTVTIPGGVLNNTEYRVLYDTPDGVEMTTEDKTITGFKIVAPFAYGEVGTPKTVDWVVVVATAQASSTSGEVDFTDVTGPSVDVVFTTAMETDQYRVIRSPDGFYQTRVTNKTKTGFTLEIGATVPAGDTWTVGYDVFVG